MSWLCHSLRPHMFHELRHVPMLVLGFAKVLRKTSLKTRSIRSSPRVWVFPRTPFSLPKFIWHRGFRCTAPSDQTLSKPAGVWHISVHRTRFLPAVPRWGRTWHVRSSRKSKTTHSDGRHSVEASFQLIFSMGLREPGINERRGTTGTARSLGRSPLTAPKLPHAQHFFRQKGHSMNPSTTHALDVWN